jgi:hypothetical protein
VFVNRAEHIRPLAHGWTARAATVLLAGSLAWPTVASGQPIPVELRQTEAGWQLLRGGEPYFIRGAGGEASLQALAAAGPIRSGPGAVTSAPCSTTRMRWT